MRDNVQRAAWGMQAPILDHSPMRVPGRSLNRPADASPLKLQLQPPRPKTSAAPGAQRSRGASPLDGPEGSVLGNPLAVFAKAKAQKEILQRVNDALEAFDSYDQYNQPLTDSGEPISWKDAVLALRDAIDMHLAGADDTSVQFEKILTRLAKSMGSEAAKADEIPDGPSVEAHEIEGAANGLDSIEKTTRSRGKLQLIHEREVELFGRVADKAHLLYEQVAIYSQQLELSKEAEDELRLRVADALEASRQLASQLALVEAEYARVSRELESLKTLGLANASKPVDTSEADKARAQLDMLKAVLGAERDTMRDEHEAWKKRISFLEAERDSASLQAQNALARAARAEEADMLEAQLHAARAEASEARETEQRASAQLSGAQAELERARTELDRLRSEQRERDGSEHARVAQANAAVEARIERVVAERLSQYETQVRDVNSEMGRVREQLEVAETAGREARDALRRRSGNAEGLLAELQRLEAEQKLLVHELELSDRTLMPALGSQTQRALTAEALAEGNEHELRELRLEQITLRASLEGHLAEAALRAVFASADGADLAEQLAVSERLRREAGEGVVALRVQLELAQQRAAEADRAEREARGRQGVQGDMAAEKVRAEMAAELAAAHVEMAALRDDSEDLRQQVAEERKAGTASAMLLHSLGAARDEALRQAAEAKAALEAAGEQMVELRNDIKDDRLNLRDERRLSTANMLRLGLMDDELAAAKRALQLARSEAEARAAELEAALAAARAGSAGVSDADADVAALRADLDAARRALEEAEAREAELTEAAAQTRQQLQAEADAAMAQLELALLQPAQPNPVRLGSAREPQGPISRLERAAAAAVAAVAEVARAEDMTASDAAVIVRAAVSAALSSEAVRLGRAELAAGDPAEPQPAQPTEAERAAAAHSALEQTHARLAAVAQASGDLAVASADASAERVAFVDLVALEERRRWYRHYRQGVVVAAEDVLSACADALERLEAQEEAALASDPLRATSAREAAERARAHSQAVAQAKDAFAQRFGAATQRADELASKRVAARMEAARAIRARREDAAAAEAEADAAAEAEREAAGGGALAGPSLQLQLQRQQQRAAAAEAEAEEEAQALAQAGLLPAEAAAELQQLRAQANAAEAELTSAVSALWSELIASAPRTHRPALLRRQRKATPSPSPLGSLAAATADEDGFVRSVAIAELSGAGLNSSEADADARVALAMGELGRLRDLADGAAHAAGGGELEEQAGSAHELLAWAERSRLTQQRLLALLGSLHAQLLQADRAVAEGARAQVDARDGSSGSRALSRSSSRSSGDWMARRTSGASEAPALGSRPGSRGRALGRTHSQAALLVSQHSLSRLLQTAEGAEEEPEPWPAHEAAAPAASAAPAEQLAQRLAQLEAEAEAAAVRLEESAAHSQELEALAARLGDELLGVKRELAQRPGRLASAVEQMLQAEVELLRHQALRAATSLGEGRALERRLAVSLDAERREAAELRALLDARESGDAEAALGLAHEAARRAEARLAELTARPRASAECQTDGAGLLSAEEAQALADEAYAAMEAQAATEAEAHAARELRLRGLLEQLQAELQQAQAQRDAALERARADSLALGEAEARAEGARAQLALRGSGGGGALHRQPGSAEEEPALIAQLALELEVGGAALHAEFGLEEALGIGARAEAAMLRYERDRLLSELQRGGQQLAELQERQRLGQGEQAAALQALSDARFKKLEVEIERLTQQLRGSLSSGDVSAEFAQVAHSILTRELDITREKATVYKGRRYEQGQVQRIAAQLRKYEEQPGARGDPMSRALARMAARHEEAVRKWEARREQLFLEQARNKELAMAALSLVLHHGSQGAWYHSAVEGVEPRPRRAKGEDVGAGDVVERGVGGRASSLGSCAHPSRLPAHPPALHSSVPVLAAVADARALPRLPQPQRSQSLAMAGAPLHAVSALGARALAMAALRSHAHCSPADASAARRPTTTAAPRRAEAAEPRALATQPPLPPRPMARVGLPPMPGFVQIPGLTGADGAQLRDPAAPRPVSVAPVPSFLRR